MGLVCKWTFSFHEFYNFFLFNLLIFILFLLILFFFHTFFYRPMKFTRGDFYFIKLIFTTFFLFIY